MELMFEDDIRDKVAIECNFAIEDQGIGNYEYGDGKYTDVDMQMVLEPSNIVIEYPIETESAIVILVFGTYEEEEYSCDYAAELDSVVYNKETKTWDATYEVYEN